MPITSQASSIAASTRRKYVPTPTSRTTGRTSSANVRKSCPKLVAFATSESDARRENGEVRYVPVRLKISFQVMLRVASRLQCSVARNCAFGLFPVLSRPPRDGGVRTGGCCLIRSPIRVLPFRAAVPALRSTAPGTAHTRAGSNRRLAATTGFGARTRGAQCEPAGARYPRRLLLAPPARPRRVPGRE
jgi:hypothetical protein